jgi:hypothetical protein
MKFAALKTPGNPAVRNYLALRKVIGILGIALPPAMLLGEWLFFCNAQQPTISHYYYTGMRDVFVGTLWAIGVFLVCYKGPRDWDNVASNVAGACAILVAIFPTAPRPTPNPCPIPSAIPETLQSFIGKLHLGFAAGFFVTITIMAFLLFENRGKRKWVNWIYRGCGAAMIGCLVWMGCGGVGFWPEAISVWAFGVSWLVNGIKPLKDPLDWPTQSGNAPSTRFA